MATVPLLPNVVIIGAGGHAKVVIDLFRAAGNYNLVGLVDSGALGTFVNGAAIIGSDDDLPRLRREGVTHAHVAIGNNRVRLKLARALEDTGFSLANAISPAAILSPSTVLGRGVAVMAGAVVNAESRLEDACILNTRASLDHDGNIGEGAHIAPGCALAGNVTIGRLSFLGVGTSVIPGIEIGEGAFIGAGSCVVRAIPAHAKAYGVPARLVLPKTPSQIS
jgi:UDP-perosamine 4-acetyltransferase